MMNAEKSEKVLKLSRQPVVVELAYPCDFKSDDGEIKTISKLCFNRPKGKHLKKMSATPNMNDIMMLMAKCSGETMMLFDEMDASDVMKCSEVVTGFLESGR